MATTASHRPPPRPLDLEITIVSAKHLKNVNWRNGDLTPYVIFWLDPDRRLATKSDDSNSTKPIWNERFLIPVPPSPSPLLTLEIFHSKPSDTPKPLVGSLRVPINDLPNPDDSTVVRTFDLRRPSGRPDGKIRLKLAIRERVLPDYQNTPQPAYYYATAPHSNYGRFPPSVYNTSPSLPPPPPPPAVAVVDTILNRRRRWFLRLHGRMRMLSGRPATVGPVRRWIIMLNTNRSRKRVWEHCQRGYQGFRSMIG
ncbi:putative C2 domain-containing protein [Helianthus annuus]|nr:putative C2 domain-containing protein [Helianthus annuus]KAJ0487538.1 putative C2 domain-containing protein [Helianthus annuus]